MKLSFLALPSDERRLYIEQAATRRNVSPVILEKDFWVSWLLAILFQSKFAGALVFKGGTSLSKVFGVIERFSEDIDLSLSPEFLELPKPGTSRNQASKWLKKAEAACGAAVETQMAPVLEKAVSTTLGIRQGGWFEFITDPSTNSPVLLFHYPSALPSGFNYLKRSVKLEFGSLTDQQPTGRHPISPLVAEILPDAFPDWQCEIVALEVERTFWEKATILHTEYHRPENRPMPDRFSRHYSDTAALADIRLEIGQLRQDAARRACGQLEGAILRQRLGQVRPREARKLSACAGSRAAGAAAARLHGDADMYLSEPLSFEQVLSILAELERRINAG